MLVYFISRNKKLGTYLLSGRFSLVNSTADSYSDQYSSGGIISDGPCIWYGRLRITAY